MKSIVLAGMSGVGKSAVGLFLANKLRLNFYDTDKLIEIDENKTIPEIFSQNGENYFRKAEAEKIASLPVKDCVISIGGGAFENSTSREYLIQNCFVIYLMAEVQTIFERVKNEKNRPLLKDNPIDNIKKLLKKRENNYKLAHFAIVTDNKTVEQVADEILKCVNSK